MTAIRELNLQEKVGRISAYAGLACCDQPGCIYPADFIFDGCHLLCRTCKEEIFPRPITINTLECWYFSHREHLMRRGVGLHEASRRAMRVAKRCEGRPK